MENLAWGLQVTMLGMGFVFALLALLWGLLKVVLHVDQGEAAPVLEPAATQGANRQEAEAVPGPARVAALEPALVAAITAAVLAHASLRRKEAAAPQRMHWPGSLLHASRWVASGRLRQNRTFRKGR